MSPKRRSSKAKQTLTRVNAYKLFYFRHSGRWSIHSLSDDVGISVTRLRVFETGLSGPDSPPRSLEEFAQIEVALLKKLESVLGCRGQLGAGNSDDFSTLMQNYYKEYRSKGERTDSSPPVNSLLREDVTIKAIIFDFDGTLTQSGGVRTTWEQLWTKLGYSANDCGKLAWRYLKGEITHEEWCHITLEHFRARKLSESAVHDVGKGLKLIDGFASTIQKIRDRGIPMYIVSGSIWSLIGDALGQFESMFNGIEANVFAFDTNGVINKIAGTPYDFAGKAAFVRKVVKELRISEREILFVGNSINDVNVKSAGARTLLVNPHLTDPGDVTVWDDVIMRMDDLSEILPHLGIATSSPPVISRKVSEDLIALLAGLDRLDLSEYTVIGGYRRFDPLARSSLIDASERIIKSVLNKSLGRENYLIGAAPGSGKTYFVEEIGGALQGKAIFIPIDISKCSKEQARARLKEVEDAQGNCLCMVDEIDGRSEEKWVYDEIYKKLDLNESPARSSSVFVLVGSSGGNPENLKKAISPRYKGPDLLDRIPQNANYCIHIPAMGHGDRVSVYVSKVIEAARKARQELRYVETMAIYFAIRSADMTPRQLKMLADHSVARMEAQDTVLRYDHHFERGDLNNKAFWNQSAEAVAALEKSRLNVVQNVVVAGT